MGGKDYDTNLLNYHRQNIPCDSGCENGVVVFEVLVDMSQK